MQSYTVLYKESSREEYCVYTQTDRWRDRQTRQTQNRENRQTDGETDREDKHRTQMERLTGR